MFKNKKVKKYYCDMCGEYFELSKDLKYVATTQPNYSFITALQGQKLDSFDAWDCPKCGCQHLVKIRVPKDQKTCDICNSCIVDLPDLDYREDL